jgi:hypothetical protein
MEYSYVREYITKLRGRGENKRAGVRQFEFNGKYVLYLIKEEKAELKHIREGKREYREYRHAVVFGYLERCRWFPVLKNVKVIDDTGERAEIKSKLLEKLGKENPARKIDSVEFFERV